jgi:hypothetical protein
MKYVTCDNCGANNDPGERCDCADKQPAHNARELDKRSVVLPPKRATPPAYRPYTGRRVV